MMAAESVPLPVVLVPFSTFSSGQFGSLSYLPCTNGALSRRGACCTKHHPECFFINKSPQI